MYLQNLLNSRNIEAFWDFADEHVYNKCDITPTEYSRFMKALRAAMWESVPHPVFLSCIFVIDNAKMHKVREKYVLVWEFSRPNIEWADKADFVELLYIDEEEQEHQKDIDGL